jgi:hypothetical protein
VALYQVLRKGNVRPKMPPTNTGSNPLGPDSLARLALQSLDNTTENQIQDEFDLIALAVHAGMLGVGFRLLSIGGGKGKTGKPYVTICDHESNFLFAECKSDADSPTPLPQSWNQNDSSYTFTYAHSQSSMQFLIKIERMLRNAIISGMADGDDKHQSFQVTPLDLIRPSLTYPLRLASNDLFPPDADKFNEASNRIKDDIFQSPNRLFELGSLLKQRIVQKIAPGISKPGYSEDAHDDGDRAPDGARPGGRTEQQPHNPRPPQGDLPEPARPNPYPYNDPLADPPRPPRRDPGELYPPGFGDEYEILPRPGGQLPPGGRPMGIGERDLYPPGLGPNDPMRPFFGPGGIGGGPRGGGPGGAGGMHPTFDDPMFGGRGGEGEVYDPTAPPGARFDPVGPGHRGPPRGAGGFPGGAPPNPFGGFGSGDFI